jgi:pyruvate kinase
VIDWSFQIDDGLIVCTVLSAAADRVRVRVTNSAELGQRKGVNLPGAKVRALFALAGLTCQSGLGWFLVFPC